MCVVFLRQRRMESLILDQTFSDGPQKPLQSWRVGMTIAESKFFIQISKLIVHLLFRSFRIYFLRMCEYFCICFQEKCRPTLPDSRSPGCQSQSCGNYVTSQRNVYVTRWDCSYWHKCNLFRETLFCNLKKCLCHTLELLILAQM